MNHRLTILSGALTGFLYGMTEYSVVILEPMLRWGPRSLGPEHWFWELGLLALYTLSGAIIGAIVNALPNASLRQSPCQAVLVAGIAILLVGRLSSAGTSPAELASDAMLLLIAVLILVSVLRFPEVRWLSWLCSPWVSIPLVFGVIKIEGDAATTATALLALLALAAALALTASRSPSLNKVLDSRFIPITAAATLVLFPVLAGFSAWIGLDPPIPREKPGARAAGRPNVVLIVLDTVRADHLSVYGYERDTTPNLKALTAGSDLFLNAISAADMTLSSYGAMYTGLYPSWHGALPVRTNHLNKLGSSFVTLAETLSRNGYTSLAVLANSGYLNYEFGMDQGFDYYDVRSPVRQGGEDYYLRDAVRPVLSRFLATGEYDRMFRRADQITDSGLRIFASMKQRKSPFFLSLNYMDAHEPYLPPRAYLDRFAGGEEFDNQTLREVRAELANHRRTPRTQEALKLLSHQYDAALAFVDSEIKRLIDGLKHAGLYDQTLLIVTSDHGEAFGRRDELNHPASVHHGLVHVPLIIKYPNSHAAAGRRIERVVSGVDLLPTILDVAGIPAQANLPGHSLRFDVPNRESTVISESFTDPLQTRMSGRPTRAQRALYWGPWKFIASTTGKKELYRWDKDLYESQDVYSSEKAVADQLDRRMQSWLQLVPRRNVLPAPMDRQTVDRLRGLGYVK